MGQKWCIVQHYSGDEQKRLPNWLQKIRTKEKMSEETNKLICNYKELPKGGNLSLLDNIDFKAERKEEILQYLKNEKFFAGTRCSTLKDFVKNENTHLPTYAYSDGEYFWDDEETYHFENYDMRLNDEFINRVLKEIDNGKR